MQERDNRKRGDQNSTDTLIPPPPAVNPGFEEGETLMWMTHVHGEDQRLSEALTAEIFKSVSPELLAQVSPEDLARHAFGAMYMVDSSTYLNPGTADTPEQREQLIRRFAENMLRADIERNRAD